MVLEEVPNAQIITEEMLKTIKLYNDNLEYFSSLGKEETQEIYNKLSNLTPEGIEAATQIGLFVDAVGTGGGALLHPLCHRHPGCGRVDCQYLADVRF